MGPKPPPTAHIHIPPAPPSAVPSHAKPSACDLREVAQAIACGKRVVVVCGAGVSVAAGIPDFRSPAGLFKTLRDENPSDLLTSGKDVFDTRVFQSPQSLSLFNRTMSALASASAHAQPTSFHSLLRHLEDRGKLLRVYTQNIDALEEKAGLELGVPVWPRKKPSKPANRGVKRKASAMDSAPAAGADDTASVSNNDDTPTSTPRHAPVPLPHPALHGLLTPPKTPSRLSPSTQSSDPAHPTPSFHAPRCIPVHGTLRSLYCVSCGYSTPLRPHLSVLSTGTAPSCPKCAEIDTARQEQNKRSRGIGRLRPSVVLYGEEHNEGEVVGECVRRDLVGLGDAGPGERAKQSRRPDVLVVVGTSLQVPGTRRIVKEFSKAVRPVQEQGKPEGGGVEVTEADIFGAPDSPLTPLSESDPSSPTTPTPKPTLTPTPSPTPRRRAGTGKAQEPIKTVYVNFDYPTPARDWEGVFDVWIQGDAQVFAAAVLEAVGAVEREEAEGEALRVKREGRGNVLLEEEGRTAGRKEKTKGSSSKISRRQSVPYARTPTKAKAKAKPRPSPRTPKGSAHLLPATPESLTRTRYPHTQVQQRPMVTSSPTSPLRLKIRFPPGWESARTSMARRVEVQFSEDDTYDSEEEEEEEEELRRAPSQSEYLRKVGLGLRKRTEMSVNYRGMTR
ncbi:DHS-like NAD/FAD-binding domain-containing protein [Dacryopinax primogenitus]|uniref:DHS-like NAD/FAD-binding domain-containing protein n=1 Tax=Dacryopinax primogenitus (strain DJM 731) TaxID=1858805 RepID=M5G455_DACPD|nr:DHS-like NAD/FAD-binding domain-containing protein [Dacryopinax primogenitus]EJU05046.1 DHS-like NAD/FAD-binding domain-containing protein [Dacryopinax primogenitus]